MKYNVFFSDGVGQYAYNTINNSGVTMGIGIFTVTFVSLKNSVAPTYSRYQIQ